MLHRAVTSFIFLVLLSLLSVHLIYLHHGLQDHVYLLYNKMITNRVQQVNRSFPVSLLQGKKVVYFFQIPNILQEIVIFYIWRTFRSRQTALIIFLSFAPTTFFYRLTEKLRVWSCGVLHLYINPWQQNTLHELIPKCFRNSLSRLPSQIN